jgi:imidazolonepropionase-like amidohydrolase
MASSGTSSGGARRVAIVDGFVHPVSSEPIERGVVLIEDGRISAVGAGLPVPSDAEVISAEGKWVVPGLFDSHTHLGIHEDVSGTEGDDINNLSDPNTAGLRALDGIDIADSAFRDALSGGVTSVVVLPGSSNPWGGETLAMKTWGGRTVDEQVIKSPLGVKSAVGENPKVAWGDSNGMPMTRPGNVFVIRQALSDARHYLATRQQAEADGVPFKVDLRLEALARLLTRESSWAVHAHRHDDIVTCIRIAEEFGLDLVINHGTSAQRIVDVLAERDLPVLLGPLVTARAKLELADHSGATAGVLARAGVRFGFTTDHPEVPIYMLALQATLAVKEGLARELALPAMTLEPARILGLDNRIGSLEPGKDADIGIWSDDPVLGESRAERVLIDGRTVYEWDAPAHRGRVVEREERLGGELPM